MEYFEDPVAAYNRLAPEYSSYSKKREKYLRSLEGAVIRVIPKGAQALLDIGAGDGSRAGRIAAASRISNVVLVEPSAGMAALVGHAAELWRVRAEDLDAEAIHKRFDVITCLWNVLGHVRGDAAKLQLLGTVALLLSPTGRFCLDVNHRYNARSYGVTATCVRWIKDSVLRDFRTGDVTASWRVGESRIGTQGHVFIHREIMSLASRAGLELEERMIIDYEDGSEHRLSWLGNLLYIFRRSSWIDSSRASATS